MGYEVEYCVLCGEALKPFQWEFCSEFRREGERMRWNNSQIPTCPNEKCPRYGLFTVMVDKTLEEAQTKRKKFAKKKS